MSSSPLEITPPKNVGGRPTVISPETITKLIAAFQRGLSVGSACEMAGIGESTFYAYQKDNRAFQERVSAARSYAKALAGDVILDVLQDSQRVVYDDETGRVKKYGHYSPNQRVATAQWFLERQDPDAFGNKMTNIGEQKNTQNNYTFITDEQLKSITAATRLETVTEGEIVAVIEGEYMGGGNPEEPSA